MEEWHNKVCVYCFEIFRKKWLTFLGMEKKGNKLWGDNVEEDKAQI